jgi:hypothetical protein
VSEDLLPEFFRGEEHLLGAVVGEVAHANDCVGALGSVNLHMSSSSPDPGRLGLPTLLKY